MTNIDPTIDISITPTDSDGWVVRVPLVGHVTQEWRRRYMTSVTGTSVPATVVDLPERSWISVTLSGHEDDRQILEILDSAVRLVREADSEVQAASAAIKKDEALFLNWWSRQRSDGRHADDVR